MGKGKLEQSLSKYVDVTASEVYMADNELPMFAADEEIQAIVVSDITFYLDRFVSGHEGLVKAYTSVLELLRPHVNWFQTESMKFPKKIQASNLEAFPTWFSGTTRREEYRLALSSGRTADEVGAWGFNFWLVPEELDETTGYFQVSLPSEMLVTRSGEFISLVKTLAESLLFRSGHAGYGIQLDEGFALEERDQMQRAWCRRYMGLDCRDLPGTSEFMKNHIKGVNWLSLLDSEFTQRLGGLKELRQKFSSGIVVHELSHGIMIQAGPMARLGDRNRREDMSLYREVNRALKPLRVPGIFALLGFNADEMAEWLGRFDEE